MSNLIRHPYHLVDESPWPLLRAIASLGLTSGLIEAFHKNDWRLVFISLLRLILIRVQWWSDISCEADTQGVHSKIVEIGLRLGIILFITSEVMFFSSFFWAFFHCRLAPGIEVGRNWPPVGIYTFNPLGVPLLNTLVLLRSGVRLTWAHHALIEGRQSEVFWSLRATVILGGYFTFLQAFEYLEARFRFRDGIWGSVFFLATGFHGLHVIIGRLFLLVCLRRLRIGSFSPKHHFGFEAARWYWHFVDVVWLFLYLILYWWGS